MNVHALPATAPHGLFDRASAPAQPAATSPFAEPALFFDPPYRDEVDDTVAWHLVRYLHASCRLRYRQHVPDKRADVRPVDFVIEKDGRRIGLDLLRDEEPDPERDALVITSGLVDTLYQISMPDIRHHLHDALLLLARFEPFLFDEEAYPALADRASAPARAVRPEPGSNVLRVRYVDEILVNGEPVLWPTEKELVLEIKGLEQVMPHVDAALSRFQGTFPAMAARLGQCA